MTLNWSTLVLEIINFVVLMWLLQRFLYRPVQQLLERRQAELEHKLLEAEQQQQQAEALRQGYQSKINAWQQQQQQDKALLQIELEKRRKEALTQLQQSLQAAREKDQVLITRQRQQQRQQDQQQALDNGCRFASQLLQLCSGPELEQRLIELLIRELSSAPVTLCQALRRETSREIAIETTQPLAQQLRDTLQQQLEALLQDRVSCEELLNPQLIAGIRISLGGHVLGANIEDELHAFASISPQPEHTDAG
ncbi:MAG: F0F1 ATP synthase subunit delta [Motiliproteus sp.]